MTARRHSPTIIGSCFAVLAACALAQTPAPSAAAPAASTTPPTTSAPATSEKHPTPSTGGHAKTHHATTHRGTHTARANESKGSMREDAYRTALRQCVEGQESRRDQCLDDAISRYGRS